MLEDEPGQPFACRRGVAQLPLEHEPPAGDQVVPDMMRAVILRLVLLRGPGQRQRPSCDADLRLVRSLRELLDRMPVTIARGKVHLRVRADGVFAQDLLHHAHAIEEQRPVDRRQQPHAGDHVSHRELVGGLSLLRGAQQLLRSVSLRLERAPKRKPGRSRR